MTQQDGWIPYDGSGQPVADDVEVYVRLRDGEESLVAPSLKWCWDWRVCHSADCIIAYKIAEKST